MARVVVAGLAGDSGKTVVALGLLLAARERALPVRAFKKGPDYIDPAWLAWASGHPARNLDTYLMGPGAVRASFARHAVADGFHIVEGNRGLYDGVDALGSHSTAELAKLLDAPVLLVVNVTKVTRTAAALVLGCRMIDPQVRIAGVILNQVAGARHERVLRESIEQACGVPVVGALPRLPGERLLPERHLGLIPPAERRGDEALRRALLEAAAAIDLDRVLSIASAAPPIAAAGGRPPAGAAGPPLPIGFITDSAFTFYYPENLEALESAGAVLTAVSALRDRELPAGLAALYIGGGFPETHAARLAQNRAFLASLRAAASEGLPIYAECGGLMLLARTLRWKGAAWPMAGVFPFDVEVCDAPQGHGYSRLRVDGPNPFFPPGTTLAGHEFHYSRIAPAGRLPRTVCAVARGTGCGSHRDAVISRNVWASYTHLHALATPQWAPALIEAARRFATAGAMLSTA